MVDGFLHALTPNALLALPWLFEFWALPHHLPPEGAWKTWVIMGGRGAGKTRAGAEWVRAEVEGSAPGDPGRARRVALVGETLDQVREVMVFGESGILACSPPDRRPVWEAGRRRLVWPNGAEAQCFSAHDPETLRGPQFDAAWADEYGCAAVDRATNQPNLFLDPNSSEGALPRGSTGRRDDLIQMQYLRAMADFWADPANNPVSPVYGGPMVDMDRAHVWAWDARPFPHFPARRSQWADGSNYGRGHWLNGRATSVPTSTVVAEIAEAAGLPDVGTERLAGLVRGYAIGDTGTARSALQPLMVAQAFDCVERGGKLDFMSRDGVPVRDLAEEVVVARDDGDIVYLRVADGERAEEVRIVHVDPESDYAVRVSSERDAGAQGLGATETDLAMALTRGEGRSIARRLLEDAAVAGETVRFTLPRSRLDLGPGDVVALGGRTYRIDRMDLGEAQEVEAVRIEASLHALPDDADDAELPPTVERPGRPFALLLDLPLITGEERPHAPHIAVTADPWPGRLGVWSSDGAEGFEREATVTTRAVMGETLLPLFAAPSGVLDRGPALRVRLYSGELTSASLPKLLNGANLAAIGDGSTTNWEIVQFAEATVVAPGVWDIRTRLRGQRGTDGPMPTVWPAGSVFVLLDSAVTQVRLSEDKASLLRNFRIGPLEDGVGGDEVVDLQQSFAGIGRRPYSVAHLRATLAGGDRVIDWIRRTRSGGDRWEPRTVPLGEEAEAYLLRVRVGNDVRREVEVAESRFVYSLAMRRQDDALSGCTVEVAQISEAYGPGPARIVNVG